MPRITNLVRDSDKALAHLHVHTRGRSGHEADHISARTGVAAESAIRSPVQELPILLPYRFSHGIGYLLELPLSPPKLAIEFASRVLRKLSNSQLLLAATPGGDRADLGPTSKIILGLRHTMAKGALRGNARAPGAALNIRINNEIALWVHEKIARYCVPICRGVLLEDGSLNIRLTDLKPRPFGSHAISRDLRKLYPIAVAMMVKISTHRAT